MIENYDSLDYYIMSHEGGQRGAANASLAFYVYKMMGERKRAKLSSLSPSLVIQYLTQDKLKWILLYIYLSYTETCSVFEYTRIE